VPISGVLSPPQGSWRRRLLNPVGALKAGARIILVARVSDVAPLGRSVFRVSRPSQLPCKLHDGCNGVWNPCFCQAEARRTSGKARAEVTESSGKGRAEPSKNFSDRVFVRTNMHHRRCMKTNQRQLEAMRRKIRQGPDRSPLFVWMVDHHADLMTKDRSRRMPWIQLCVDFAKLGLKDGQGKPPTPKRAGETWREACAEVKAEAERANKAGRSTPPVQRSRRQSDWQPDSRPSSSQPPSAPAPIRQQEPSREPPQQPAQAASSPLPPSSPGKNKLDDLSPEVKAKFDRLREAFAETDRRRFGQSWG
jgi:hypothetical protein